MIEDYSFIYHEVAFFLVQYEIEESIPFKSAILQAMAPLWFLRTLRSLAFSVADSAEEIISGVGCPLAGRHIRARAVARKGRPKMIEIPNHRKRECGIRLMLAPKSARAFFTVNGPIRHGSVKLPGSSSFWGKLLWMTVGHYSLSLTEKAAFLSFSLCERRGITCTSSRSGCYSKGWCPRFKDLIFPDCGGDTRKLFVYFLTVLVKRFPYAFRVEFLFKHETGKLVLKLDFDDPFRITFLFSFLLAVSLRRVPTFFFGERTETEGRSVKPLFCLSIEGEMKETYHRRVPSGPASFLMSRESMILPVLLARRMIGFSKPAKLGRECSRRDFRGVTGGSPKPLEFSLSRPQILDAVTSKISMTSLYACDAISKVWLRHSLRDFGVGPACPYYLEHNSILQSYGSCVVGLLAVIDNEFEGFAAVLAVLKPKRLKADRARNE
nr:hypothetical protein [Tanacetum cinerariifolium]